MYTTVLIVIGTVITALLVWSVWWGIRRRAAQPPPGNTAPPRTAGRTGQPEADGAEFPADGTRRTAHELKGYGNIGTPGTDDEHR